jgi:hypothetical protein
MSHADDSPSLARGEAAPNPAIQPHADIALFLKVEENTAVSVGVSLRGGAGRDRRFRCQTR